MGRGGGRQAGGTICRHAHRRQMVGGARRGLPWQRLTARSSSGQGAWPAGRAVRLPHLHERAAAYVSHRAEGHQGCPVRGSPPRKLRCPVGAIHGQAEAGVEEDGSDAHVVLQVQGCEPHVPRGLQ